MGTPPAPPYATIYFGIHAENFFPHHAQRGIYRRFIDNVIGIWCPNKNPERDALEWNEFRDKMNAFPGLTWEFSEWSKSIYFMDMTISINNSNKIETTLFKKRLNLHLYIPPHSAHPPGLLPGIVYGTLFRIFTLCSTEEDKLQWTKVFSMPNCQWLQREQYSDTFPTGIFNRTNTSSLFTPHAIKHASNKNLHPTQFPYPTALPRCLALPTACEKNDFRISTSIFCILLSFFCHPHGFLNFLFACWRSHHEICHKNSPADSEKQIAVVCKDNGIFILTKPLLCQKPTTLVKTPPVLVLLASV